jgi:hypothetical protein
MICPHALDEGSESTASNECELFSLFGNLIRSTRCCRGNLWLQELFER